MEQANMSKVEFRVEELSLRVVVIVTNLEPEADSPAVAPCNIKP
jgi:hypothetical protein